MHIREVAEDDLSRNAEYDRDHHYHADAETEGILLNFHDEDR